MNATEHVCPLFSPVGSVKENGGTSCGNCEHFNSKHVSHAGKEVCDLYEELVFISTWILSDR